MPKSTPSLWVRLFSCLTMAIAAVSVCANAAPPLSVYGSLPAFERAVISPSGDRVALVGTASGKRQLMIISNGKILATSDISPDLKVRNLLWAGDGALLLETSSTEALGFGFTTEKAELVSVTVWPLDGSTPWQVFEKERFVTGGVRGFYGVRVREGKWYGYFGGMTLKGMTSTNDYLPSTNPVLYEVDLQTAKIKPVSPRADRETVSRRWLVDGDGVASVVLDFDSKASTWTIRNRANEKVASGVQPLGGIDLIGFGGTPGTFIYGEDDAATDKTHWYEMPMAGGERKEILPDVDISQAYFDYRTGRLLGYQAGGDTPAYQFFDRYQAKVVAATQKAFPGRSVHLVHWNDTFDRLIVQTEGPSDPLGWWQVDIKTGKAEQLGSSYTVAGKDVGPMQMIHYKASDGLDIGAVLTLPPGRPAKNLPVVVLPHGGPGARDFPGFDWTAQALATRGYAVLQPNFRGSTGYGTAFERAGDGEWGRKMQSDISDGLAQLVKDGTVDPKRACIVGMSYGGYAALAGVTLQQGVYRCAVSFAGLSDLGRLVLTEADRTNANATMMRSLKRQLGAGRDLGAVSPLRFAARADAPILLIHGKNDTVVNYDQSNDMAAALRRANKPVELVTLTEADHWLSKSATRAAMLDATVAFLAKYNPPDPESQ